MDSGVCVTFIFKQGFRTSVVYEAARVKCPWLESGRKENCGKFRRRHEIGTEQQKGPYLKDLVFTLLYEENSEGNIKSLVL